MNHNDDGLQDGIMLYNATARPRDLLLLEANRHLATKFNIRKNMERFMVNSDYLGVLESTRSLYDNFSLVRINKNELQRWCANWSSSEFITPAWDNYVHWDGEGEALANYILLLDSLNFCFWPDKGQPKWTISYGGRHWNGYQALALSLRRAIEEGRPILEAAWMAQASLEEVTHIFRGLDPQAPIPLLEKRAAHIRQSGQVLQEHFKGQFAEVIRAAQGSAVRLVNLLVQYFPSFRDIHPYQGQELRILKRAQITPIDLYGSFHGQDLGSFSDLQRLTACADYKIPQVLRALGILEYAPSLADKVDNQELLPSGSLEELATRVGPIWATELIRQRLEELGVKKMALELDWFLWNLGQEPLPHERPYHRTRTIFY